VGYLGNNLQAAYSSYLLIDSLTASFNGTTTSFPLRVNGITPVPFPVNEQNVLISVGGVPQKPDPTGAEGFRFSGSNIIFSSAPKTGEAFWGVVLAGADYINVGADFPDGSVSAPSITFASEKSTGFYKVSSGTIGVTLNGSLGPLFTGSGVYLNNTNNGLYSPGTNQLALSTAGTGRLFINSSGYVLVNTSTGSGSAPLQVNGSIGLAPNSTIQQWTNSDVGTLKVLATQFIASSSNSGSYSYSGGGLIASVDNADGALLLDVGRASSSPLGRFKVTNTAGGQTAISLGNGSSTTLYAVTGGNVGIGTASPVGKLEVSTGNAEGLRLSSASYLAPSEGPWIAFNGGPFAGWDTARIQGIRLGANAEGGLVFYTNTGGSGAGTIAEKARIDNSGRLLVGTSTSGTSLLQVNAQASANGNAFRSVHRIADTGTGLTQTGTAAPYISYLAGLSAALSATAIAIVGEDFAAGNTGLQLEFNYVKSTGAVASGDRLGRISFGGDDATNVIPAAQIAAFVDGTPGTNDMPGRLVFFTTADGAALPTERVRIDSSGRVLVGTTSTSGFQTGVYHVLLNGSSTAYGSISVGTIPVTGNATDLNLTSWTGSGANFFTSRIRQAGDGSLQIFTQSTVSSDGAGTVTERMRLDASTGNLLVGTTTTTANGGKLQVSNGVTFPATQVACTDVNTLDDYEEGTWTPAIAGTTLAGAGTYSVQVGRYTKIGNTVTVHLNLTWSAHTGTGNMTISGLPFTSANVTNLNPTTVAYANNLTITGIPVVLVTANATTGTINSVNNGTAAALAMDTAATFTATITYQTA
jgi:hypothetical protein